MKTVSEIFQSKYLGAADLKGRPHVLVIATAEAVAIGPDGKQQTKIQITFQGAKKTFLANKTNSKRIAFIHGEALDGWIGKEVELYVDMVDYQGDVVEAIRVRKAPDSRAPAGNGREMQVHDRGTHQITTLQGRPDVSGDEIPF